MSVSYSKTCLKPPLKNRQNKGLNGKLQLNEGRKYCRMLQGEHSPILRPAFSNIQSLKPIFGLLFEWLLKTGFTVHLLYTMRLKFSNFFQSNLFS